MNDERWGGRLAVLIGALVSLVLVIGAGIQAGGVGTPAPEVFGAMGITFGTSVVIGIGIGCYNMGRKRDR